VATVAQSGPWKEAKLRAGFRDITAWAKKNGVRTGRWFLQEGRGNRWIVGIEVKGKARSQGRVRLRTFPAATVATAVFDPDVVAPHVIYHGLIDWLRWQRKEGKIQRVLSSREVYRGDPWSDPKAWAHAEVQFVVRK
jgi:effector-binding domain-containing protein